MLSRPKDIFSFLFGPSKEKSDLSSSTAHNESKSGVASEIAVLAEPLSIRHENSLTKQWNQDVENKADVFIENQHEWHRLFILLSRAFSDREINPNILKEANRVYKYLEKKLSILSIYFSPPYISPIQQQAYDLLLLNKRKLKNIEKIFKENKLDTLSVINRKLTYFEERLHKTKAKLNSDDQKSQNAIANEMETTLFEINDQIQSIPYVNLTKKQHIKLTNLSLLLVSTFKKSDTIAANHLKLRLQQLGIFNKQSNLSLIHDRENALKCLEEIKNELSQVAPKNKQPCPYDEIISLTHWAIKGLQSTPLSSYYPKL